jgi:hypothetical protein
MTTSSLHAKLSRNKNVLAAAIIVAGGFAASNVYAANTWTVNSCSDANSGSGFTGTLRYAVANAATGDTVDMTTLGCSLITLKSGAVAVTQADLTINGVGSSNLFISGKYNGVATDRIFKHTGTGTLNLKGMTVYEGYMKSGSAAGGCIYSAGSVNLNDVYVAVCEAKGTASSFGGGIYAKGQLKMKYSTISFSETNGGNSFGGGFLAGSLYMKYSTVSGNEAADSAGGWSEGSTTIKSSTFSGNSASVNVGGLRIITSSPVLISNSTISGNSAAYLIGGVYANAPTVTVQNSTIVFNTAAKDRAGATPPFSYYAPGVSFVARSASQSVTLQSNLISNNTASSGGEYDLSTFAATGFSVTFNAAPANNLIRSTFSAVPSDTIKLSCPRLGPLRNNGGATETHALQRGSPGIDQGNNAANLAYDQRGIIFPTTPAYPRVDNGVADIGAYERNQEDMIFDNGFEGCPLLF